MTGEYADWKQSWGWGPKNYSAWRKGRERLQEANRGKVIQIVRGMPECHRRQILSLTLVMPPPLFFPREAALCLWTPRPCLSGWASPSGKSCRRWGRKGGCSIYSTSPYSWSLCAGGDRGWRHSFHRTGHLSLWVPGVMNPLPSAQKGWNKSLAVTSPGHCLHLCEKTVS